MPTPKPKGLVQVPVGAELPVAVILGSSWIARRPLAVHVVNLDCPCSRFNEDHLRALVRRFGHDVTFVALVQGDGDPSALISGFNNWGTGVEAIADPGGTRATQLGVYSTPQAVIVDSHGRLFYRGNYNTSRYCVDRRTEFARLALEALLSGGARPSFPTEATTAYGCPLSRLNLG